jgi:catechol 2,3-dioxygenase-like lactoylglutathione lyase family enzyme
MKKVTLFKLFTKDQDEAIRFYVDKLGFELAEDKKLGDYRWVILRLPDNAEFSINLESARSEEEKALVGRQAGRQPLFSLTTDDCMGEYAALKARGVSFDGEPKKMPFGTGVMLQDLYGNKIYMMEEPR